MLIIPIAASSAIIPEIVVAGVSPGTATISIPTLQTQVIASSLLKVIAPFSAALIIPISSLTGINAPESPPTFELAITPPFLTASFNMARAAVVPCPPTESSPISSNICATLSPITGVGASDKSTIPNSAESLLDASFAISCPVRVILNAVFLIVSAISSTDAPFMLFNA